MQRTTKTPLYDLLQQFKTEVFKELRACLPGTVAIVNADGTVDVDIGVSQRHFKVGVPSGTTVAYPRLTNCPLWTPQGGKVGFVSPPAVNDECLVVFSDRCLDTWMTTGTSGINAVPLPSVRMHDIADGFVLVGLNTARHPLLTSLAVGEGGICETNNAVGAKIAMNPTTHLITVQNATQSLYLALTALITSLAALNTAIAGEAGTIPTAAAVAAANEAAIVLVQTSLSALLY